MVSEFIEMVSERNALQKKQLRRLDLSEEEIEEFEGVLCFLSDVYGCSLDFLAESYLFLVDMIKEEQYYFAVNGRYRNSTFAEVDREVYHNQNYMDKYMTGLALSDYIWKQHLKMIRFFEVVLREQGRGNNYLEIGPGFGQYLIRAVQARKFCRYFAVDVSPTSVQKCQAYLAYRGLKDICEVVIQDFFEFSSEQRYSFIVMGEVLEHVERPLDMLKKIYSLLEWNGQAYISTVINAPAIDHIYLFRNEEEVFDMISQAGFEIKNHICTAAGDIKTETAMKKSLPVNIAMILTKGRNKK